MGRITVLRGPERRRRWSTEELRRILEEAFAPGACVAQVAREHEVSTALIYNWRRKLCLVAAAAQEDHGFVEAVVLEDKAITPISGQPVNCGGKRRLEWDSSANHYAALENLDMAE